MPSLDPIVQITGSFGPFVAITIATFLIAEALLRGIVRRRQKSRAVNKRLQVLEETKDGQAALIELRRSRGLTADGGYSLPLRSLNALVLQSGASLAVLRVVLLMAVLAVTWFILAFSITGSLPIAALSATAVGMLLPILALFLMRSRRLRKLEDQLPEAVDIVVRSLRAGHPVPVSIALVAREMPDPIGTEFGLLSDEMTYGLDLQTAMGNLRERTGQSDVGLLAVAVSIQARTGGNLAELLSKLSKMIRERARMRRKVHALSAEGRMSAIALSIVPVAVYLIVNWRAPSYYADVANDGIFMPAVYAGLFLWVTGMFVMYRLVNFKI